MKIKSKHILKKLVEYGVYPTKQVDARSKDMEDVIYDYGSGYLQVLTDSVADEEVKLLLEIKQLDTLKSIKGMVVFITVVNVLVILGILGFYGLM